MQNLKPIPVPPAPPVLGHTLQIRSGGGPVQSLMQMAKEHGPIFRVNFPGRTALVVTNHELIDELCDNSRFDKYIHSNLQHTRDIAKDGLFTAHTNEPNWRKAHDILLPAFSMQAMSNYFPMMLDIAEQLVGKWGRLNPQDDIDVANDMTRLALDTISLCAFDYRFNSFFQNDLHPFIKAFFNVMNELRERPYRLPIQARLRVAGEREYHENIQFLNSIVDEVIQSRKQTLTNEDTPQDLLQLMLTGTDKQSGTGLDDENIRYQIITFLIAGHETTSGWLSFALYYLMKYPAILQRAYAEVDQILGTDLTQKPTFRQVSQLQYIKQILNETLRLWPVGPVFVVYPYEDTVIGGKYAVKKEEALTILLPALHRDKAVWGDNPELFDPENFSPENMATRPPNAYKPFGNGQRACIGRQFAMQEASLALGMILQRFKFVDEHNYQLQIHEALSLKPGNFYMRVRPRTAADRAKSVAQFAPVIAAAEETAVAAPAPTPSNIPKHDTPLLVLFGSNLGTSEAFARRIASDAQAQGYDVTLADLDAYTDNLPTTGGILIVSASYNGQPPDNSVKFCEWINNVQAGDLEGVRFAVFGTGNRDWAATYQNIPRMLEQQLLKGGAEQILPRGEADGRGDFFGDFDRWYRPLWQQLADTFELEVGDSAIIDEPLFAIEVVSNNPIERLSQEHHATSMTVLENRELADPTSPIGSSKRHLVIELPQGSSYKTGDHFGVLGQNSQTLIERVTSRFQLDPHAVIVINKTRESNVSLPTGTPISVQHLLAHYVELQMPATQNQIRKMIAHMPETAVSEQLKKWAAETESDLAQYQEDILKPRVSWLDLLEEFPACALPFHLFLEHLPTIAPRYYSISSSHMQQKEKLDLTVSVLDAPAWSGRGQYVGLCSNYLASVPAGEQIQAYVRDVKSEFLPPANPQTAVIMVCAGTGLAPFRGFLQDRAELKKQGTTLGDALLFYGCRHPDVDYMYKEELQRYEANGLVNIHMAFSRIADERMYVQDQVWAQRDAIWNLMQNGASFYICGEGRYMVTAVRQTLEKIYAAKGDVDEETAVAQVNQLEKEQRYLVDAWSG